MARGLEVFVAVDHAGVEAPLEEVADAVVAAVEALRMEAVESLHSRGEGGLCRLDHEVKVVVEQDPRVQHPVEAALDVLQGLLPPATIDVVEHDRPLLDPACCDEVVGRTGKE